MNLGGELGTVMIKLDATERLPSETVTLIVYVPTSVGPDGVEIILN